MAVARTNLTLPEDLLREVDALAGPRGRSAYVAEAVAQRVKRDRLERALAETRGAMIGKPGQRSRDDVLRWVRQLRTDDRDPWPPTS
jgi:metal-responsive CopG/Arc/MetJ family transcriptional regulator